MKVYIYGPMTGYPDFNFPAFAEAAADLRAQGMEVVSPAELNPETDGQWEDYLRRDLMALLGCDTIALLPGWSHSRGALLEHHVAFALAFKIMLLLGAETLA